MHTNTCAVKYGATIFGLPGPQLLPDEAAFFRQSNPFGFILFARNIETPEQLRRLTGDLRAAVGWHAPIFVDQEGGRVQRLRGPYWREWLPPLHAVQQVVAQGGDPVRMMWLRARLIGAELWDMGIDGNCAPCVDLVHEATHEFLKNRCLGDDRAHVATLGRACAMGFLAAGVLPVIKHMPGHGRAHLDTHFALPQVDAPKDALEDHDFGVFHDLADLPLGMTGHVVFSAYDGQPATCSPVMIDVIRRHIGFQGLLMSDDLNMKALSGSLYDRTARAIGAGCDIALHCHGDMAEMHEVAQAAGQMGPDAMARAARALAARRLPDAADLPALLAEHDALLGKLAYDG